MWQIFPYFRLEIIVYVLVVESEIDDEGNSKERVVKQVIGLCVVESTRKCTLSQIVKNNEGNDHIFPTEKDEKV